MARLTLQERINAYIERLSLEQSMLLEANRIDEINQKLDYGYLTPDHMINHRLIKKLARRIDLTKGILDALEELADQEFKENNDGDEE